LAGVSDKLLRNLCIVTVGERGTPYYQDSGADYICLREGEVTVPKLLVDLDRVVGAQSP
jgi:hypothetical protein